MPKCCNIKVSVKTLAETLIPMLGLDKTIDSQGGTLTGGTLVSPSINGSVTFDSEAKASLCTQLEECTRDIIKDTPYVDTVELDGSALVLKKNGSELKRVDFGNLVPAAKADRFLSEVNYKRDQKILEFVTSAAGEQNQTFTVPLEDLLNTTVDPTSLAGDGLEARDGKLYVKSELCTLDVKSQGSYTVQATDDIILATGGTVTFPTSIPVGRAFTVIQTTDSEVTLASDGTLNPPKDKTLTLVGKNSVATVIKTSSDTYYVVGDMK